MLQTIPHLFDHDPVDAPAVSSAMSAEKSVIDKLLKVRRSLAPAEQRFALPRINLLIDELRSLMRATPTQAEEMILWSIERQGAVSETEIAGDTKLHRVIIAQLVASMIERGILYKVRRRVPGSDRPNFAIKSNRVKTPEAD